MRKFLVMGLTIVGVLLCVSNIALAQSCTADNQNKLTTCIDDAATLCVDVSTSCETADSAVTVDDVEDYAREKCCGKSKAAQRKSCLTALKLTLAVKPVIRDFAKAARARIQELKTSDCGDVGYAALF